MKKETIKKFYDFIDQARVDVPKLKDPSILFLYQDEKEGSIAHAFAYFTPESFAELFGNFLVQNPHFITSAQTSIDGALNIINENKNNENGK